MIYLVFPVNRITNLSIGEFTSEKFLMPLTILYNFRYLLIISLKVICS